MKKKYIVVIGIVVIIISIFPIYSYLRVKFAKVEIKLKQDNALEFNDTKKITDFIESINGKISDNYVIDSSKLGKQKVAFKFINEDGIKLSSSLEINVVDTVEPVIWLGNRYQVEKGSKVDITKKILCGDNYDNKPSCYVEGNYDMNTVGSYSLIFKAIDNSNNVAEQPFTLQVVEPKENTTTSSPKVYTYFDEVVKTYKKNGTKIGLDVSSWQGDIDFEKIKQAGVEFLMIRVGGTKGTNKEYFVDKKFIRNITEANKHNIPVGVYFYSYSNSSESSIKDAKWVLKQIKDYKVDLPIAFDWEEWQYFNDYNLSFFGLTSMADEFLNTVEKSGYKGILYSSKTYLEKIWLPGKYDTWLAHYTKETNYEGKYRMWQLCDNGKIDGIEGEVDINIMYE